MSNTAGGWFTNTYLDHNHPVTVLHLVVTRCSCKAIKKNKCSYKAINKNSLKTEMLTVETSSKRIKDSTQVYIMKTRSLHM